MRRKLLLAFLFIAGPVVAIGGTKRFDDAGWIIIGAFCYMIATLLVVFPGDAKKPPAVTGGSRSGYITGIPPAPAAVPDATNDAGSADSQS